MRCYVLRAPNILFLLHAPQMLRVCILMRCVRSWRLRQQCVADERLRDSNASLRARKMFYFCYANRAVATAIRRYIHVNVIFLLHMPQSVACVSFVYLCVRKLGDCSYDSDASLRGRSGYLRRRYVAPHYMRSWRLRQRCVATRTNDYATAMRRYVRVKCSISATRTERLRQRCVAIYT